MDPNALSLFVACAPGLESLLLSEMVELGLAGPEASGKIVAGGVELAGDLRALYRANVELGLATHVRCRVGELQARHLSELERACKRLPWARWLGSSMSFRVDARSRSSRLYHTGAIAERVARAIAETTRATPDRDAPHRVHVRFERDRGIFSVETSGEPLYRRGYRRGTTKAPFSPDLARALLLVSGWDRASDLLDPMMGSGTIPIEAAILARRLPPGGHREFAFMALKGYDEALFVEVREKAFAASLLALPFRIFGSDRDAGALGVALENAERAGVAADLELERASLSETLARFRTSAHLSIVTNPPYGKRVGKNPASLRTLYQHLGRLAEESRAVRVAIAAGDTRLARASGLPLRSALLTDHGGLKVSLMVTP